MAKVRGAVVVNIEGCKGCGVCVPACPSDVLELAKQVNGKGYHYSYMAIIILIWKTLKHVQAVQIVQWFVLMV